MAHRIKRHEAIADGLLRLVREDLDKARHALHGHEPRAQRIHRIRQRLKRVRSVLTVLEPQLGAEAADARRAVAAAARLLAGARDADAAAASARELRAAPGATPEAGLDRVVASLSAAAEEAHHRAPPVEEVRARLAAVEHNLADAPGKLDDGKDLLADALRRSYRKGRRAMAKSEATLSTPDLHRWRKRVKDLGHLLALAGKRLPRRLEQERENLDRLGELLGQDHDHAILAEKLALSPEGDPALMSQLAVIARERRRLEREAFAIGAELYSRKPRKFAKATRLR
jgi:CHAD domain-containing protein